MNLYYSPKNDGVNEDEIGTEYSTNDRDKKCIKPFDGEIKKKEATVKTQT
jgi:hypothetical protein